MMRAFNHMLACITAADASQRQVNGVLAWREYAERACELASSREGTRVLASDSRTHRAWRAAAASIADALDTQAELAAIEAAEAEIRVREAQQAAAAATAAAAQAQAAADRASKDDDGAGWARAMHEVSRCQREADAQRQSAEKARKDIDAATSWMIAAMDARDVGRNLIESEDKVSVPVGEALRAAGGVSEVYGDKRALVMDGAL
jgi:hypothetical protein